MSNFKHPIYGEAIGVSCNNKEVFMIMDSNNQIIYSKPNTSCTMLYKDMSVRSEKNYEVYDVSRTTTNLSVCNKYDYTLNEPYSTTLGGTNQKGKILGFWDTTEQITSLNDNCFYDCTSLTAVSFPYVTSLNEHCFANCTSLEFLNISSVNNLNSTQISNTKLQYLYIDSNTLKSIENGYGKKNQIVVWKEGDDSSLSVAAVVPLVTRISNDNICYFPHWSVSIAGRRFTDLITKNLSVSVESATWHHCSELTNIVIDNANYKSISPHYDNNKKLIVVGKANGSDEFGTRLRAISPHLTALSGDSYQEIADGCFYIRKNRLSRVDINNDYFTTHNNGKILTSKDGTKLITVLPNVSYEGFQNTIKYIEEQLPNLSSFECNAFNQCVNDGNVRAYAQSLRHDNIKIIKSCCLRTTNILSIYLPNLETAYWPGADNVHTKYCYFPKLKEISDNFWRQTGIISRSLEEVYAPEVTSIGGQAFMNNSKFKIANYPKSTFVRYRAFYNCTSLKNVNLSSCTYFSSEIFANCTSLTSLTCTSITKSKLQELSSSMLLHRGCTCHCSDGDITT